ncbi:MAG: cation:dicarboxylase symporter family transporter [Mycobacterium sp.]|nr:cation:dicarboxylase symporter family transporter [Mycobacterium sp.]
MPTGPRHWHSGARRGGNASPGAGMEYTEELDPALAESAGEALGWQDTLLNFVSTNIFSAMSTATMVPIIVFSLLFGIALRAHINTSGDTGVLTFIDQIQQIVLTMIRLVMYIAPIGVFCLLAALAGDVGFSVVTTALKYLGTTLLGVLILFMLFVAVVTVHTRLNPWKLPNKLAEQTAIAITTTSSAVTFPTVLKNTVEMFLATSLDLPFEAVGLLIAVDWFAGIFRTFLNVNGDTFVAMLVANADDEIDRDVYNGDKVVIAEEIDMAEYSEAMARADRAD